MSVRPHPPGTDPQQAKAWIIDYYDETRRRRQLLYRGTQAEALEIEHSFRIKSKRMPVSAHPSLAEASTAYIEHYKIEHLAAGSERMQRSMKLLLQRLGRYHFPSITDPVVEMYKRDRLADGVKPSTINKELAALSGFCKWARDQGWCEHLRIKRFPAKLARAPIPSVPSRREVVLFLRAVPRQKRGIWAAMYYCGLRVSEARGLNSRSVNWPLRILVITGKGNKQRVVPINKKLAPYLRNSLPFKAAQDLRSIAHWASKRAKVETYIYPHLMRHAFGVHMTERGVPLRALQDIMGHSSSQITEIYSRLAAEALTREMDKF